MKAKSKSLKLLSGPVIIHWFHEVPLLLHVLYSFSFAAFEFDHKPQKNIYPRYVDSTKTGIFLLRTRVLKHFEDEEN